jgi:hypothetical protein
LKAASRVPEQDSALQELKMLHQERERLLEIKQRKQLVEAQLSDPLDAPHTALLRQSTAEHYAELERIRASSKGALSARPMMEAADLEAEALLAQYEADLYSEELQANGVEDEAEAVLTRTASGSLIEEANRLIATSSRQLIELEHERRVGPPPMPPTTARSTVAPSTRTAKPASTSAQTSGGDDGPLMKIARVKMPASTGGSSPPSLGSYGLDLSEALQVLAVRPGSASATVPVGATLREITGYPVESLDDIEQALHVLPAQLRGASLEFVFTYSAPNPKPEPEPEPEPEPRPTPAATRVPEGVPPARSPAHGDYSVPTAAVGAASVNSPAERCEEKPAAAAPPATPPNYGAQPVAVQSDPPRSAGRARPQPLGDPLAMHRPRPQGARRRPPARGLLAARKKQGRH